MSTYEWFTCFAALCLLVVIAVAFYDDYQYRKAMRELREMRHKFLYEEIRDDDED